MVTQEKEEIPVRIRGSKSTFDAVWDGRKTTCRGKTCGAEVGWAVTKRGKKAIFEIEGSEQAPDGVEVFETHWGRCVNSDDFKT